ncbi:MAG TPA: HAMP domain-containing sensor histidine kinase [Alphaproteobacteria bacterium]|nr:HAMP domain-containing sensor histidine kinase [Alphaproteobacteria bacterium]HPR55458.1 HAMP domain-containing sensor histidine kinase [Deltaproteobacteria bacterium]
MDGKPPRTGDTRVFTLEGPPLRRKDIARTIEKVVRDLPVPGPVRLRVTADLSDPFVWMEEERIAKAVENIAVNAIEAMPDGGELAVDVSGDEGRVVITIQDTGTGITGENMDQLFTPFFTTKPVGEGLGLGLPTAYAAVKAHGGTIAVESNADASSGPTGTTVRITLPRGGPVEPETTNVILHEDD